MEPANADPLAPSHRDVLLYQVGQHACGEAEAPEEGLEAQQSPPRWALLLGLELRLSLPALSPWREH